MLPSVYILLLTIFLVCLIYEFIENNTTLIVTHDPFSNFTELISQGVGTN